MFKKILTGFNIGKKLGCLIILLLIFFDLPATILNVPNDYNSIQAGIEAANNGDTILVQPGTYVENINFNGKKVILGSLFLTSANQAYISQTVINGNQVGPVVSFETNGDYYEDVEGLIAENLKSGLYNLIKNHEEFSYNNLRDFVLPDTDEDPDNPNNIIQVYTGVSKPKNDFGGGVYDWNREHVWAKSHGDFGNSPPAGTDAHHLRPSDVYVNSLRGNRDFDYGGDPVYTYSGSTLAGYRTDDTFEPLDEVKGDIARMIFYMAVRYEGDDGEPDLEMVDFIPSSPNGEPYHAKESVLLQWHYLDPVDDWERTRNNKIYNNWQGNRNPFIDHPEFAGMIWNYSSTLGYNCRTKIRDDYQTQIIGFTIANGAAGFGGGIYCNNSSPLLKNLVIINNCATHYGGGIYCSFSEPAFTNVTISNNIANKGGAIYCDYNTDIIISNTIASYNSGAYGIYLASGNSNIKYNDTYDNEIGNYYGCNPGIGCFSSNPRFVDSSAGNYNLSWDNFPASDSTKSPCIDAGDPNLPLNPDESITDIGAFFFDQTILQPPSDLTLEFVNEQIILQWNAVEGANSYIIYSSNNPSSGFAETATTSDTIWTNTIINENREFYYIKASF